MRRRGWGSCTGEPIDWSAVVKIRGPLFSFPLTYLVTRMHARYPFGGQKGGIIQSQSSARPSSACGCDG